MFEGWTPKEGDQVRNRSTKTPGILRKSPRGNWYADRPGVPEGERFYMRSLEEVWHFLEPDPAAESLVLSVHASGREVLGVTYNDGPARVDFRLLFRTPEEASECARVLKEAKRPAR